MFSGILQPVFIAFKNFASFSVISRSMHLDIQKKKIPFYISTIFFEILV